MNIRLLPALLATAASLLFAGCLPESKNPLSTPKTSMVDVRLDGLYVPRRQNRNDDLEAMHFHYRGMRVNGQTRMTPQLEVLGVTHEKNGDLKTHSYRVLTTHIGTLDYMSIQDMDKNGDKTVYNLARYEISLGDTLRIWFLNADAAADAIHAGKLHGTVKKGKYTTDVTITDSTERLAAFVKAGDTAKLFEGKPMTLYRLTR